MLKKRNFNVLTNLLRERIELEKKQKKKAERDAELQRREQAKMDKVEAETEATREEKLRAKRMVQANKNMFNPLAFTDRLTGRPMSLALVSDDAEVQRLWEQAQRDTEEAAPSCCEAMEVDT